MKSVPIPTLRRAQQAVVAIVILAMTFTSSANTVTYSGGTPLNTGNVSPTFVWPVIGFGEDVVIDIDTQSLVGPAGTSIFTPATHTGNQTLNLSSGLNIGGGAIGVWMNTLTGNLTGNINGNIDAVGNVLTFDSRWAGDGGGDIKISGTGSIGGTSVGAGIWALADTGKVTIDGFSSIKGGTFGILVNHNGSWLGTNAGGDVNIGQTTPIGAITATGGHGIYVDQLANLTGDGKINIKATDITATGWTVRTIAWTGDTNIAFSGTLKSDTNSVYATSTSGDINIDGMGMGIVDGAVSGITVDPIGSGDISVKNIANVKSAAGWGIWTLADSGKTDIDNIAAVNAGQNGIFATSTTGAIDIGRTTPIGPVNAVGYGIYANSVAGGAVYICGTSVTTAGIGVQGSTLLGAPVEIHMGGLVKSTASDGIWGTSDTGNVLIEGRNCTGSVDAANTGIYAITSGNIDITNWNGIKAGGSSILFTNTVGNTNINKTGNLTAGVDGILGTSTTGNITIDNVGAIDAGVDGINVASTSGDINIGQTTPITSIDAGANGVIGTSTSGDVKTTFNGLIKAGASGILSTSATGDTLVDGKGTGTIDAGVFGVKSATDGKIDVVNIADIKSASTGIWTTGFTGATNIDNIGKVNAGLDGIYATSTTGLIDIGRTTPIGPVTATNLGIYANSVAGGPVYICATDVTSANIAITGSSAGAGNVEIHAGGIVKSTANDGIWGVSGTGNVIIEGRLCTGSVDAFNDGIYAITNGNIDITNWNGIKGQTGYGILTTNTVGNTNINKTGNITAALDGILSTSTTGNITADTIGDVTAGARGIAAATAGGNIDIGQVGGVGTINATLSGVEAIVAGAGHINVTASTINSTAGYGIHTAALTGNTVIKDGGTITSLLTGIYGTSTTGSITADGLGTGIVNATGAGSEGITLDPGVGATADANVLNFAKITGADAGIWTPADGGTVNIQGNKSIEGKATWGILASNTTGDINIGTTADNGPILGKTTGIETINVSGDTNIVTTDTVTGTTVNGITSTAATGDINIEQKAGEVKGQLYGMATTNATGDTHIITNDKVTGTTLDGIQSLSTTGDIKIEVKKAIVEGELRGIDALAAGGTVDITVEKGATVQGKEFGTSFGSVGGKATFTNKGLLQDTTDTGAASDPGGDAFIATAGEDTLNNTGVIVGRGHSLASATKFDINNQAGGLWTPGTGINNFAGANDTVNNAGIVQIRTGSTDMSNLENFNNLSGGLINLSYGPGATDDLKVGNFSAKKGSSINFDVSSKLANNSGAGFDSTTNGKGTADTIVVTGSSKPEVSSKVNLNHIDGTQQALAGSVSLVYTGKNLVHPNPGDKLSPSKFYEFGLGDPTTEAVAYYLVDDGQGGVYLQWVPNLTPLSLGAYAGGDLFSGDDIGSGLGAAAGRLGGGAVGGIGFGGGPSGGGVFGGLSDRTVSNNMLSDAFSTTTTTPAAPAAPSSGKSGKSPVQPVQATSTTTAYCPCKAGKEWDLWFNSSGASTDYFAGGQGTTYGISAGTDRDLHDVLGTKCGLASLGLFGYYNWSDDSWARGSMSTEGQGAGVYFRTGTESGYYANVLGTIGWSASNLYNDVFHTTADQDSMSYSAMAAIGKTTKLGKSTQLDTRAYASFGSVLGDEFTDSNGMTVDETNTQVTTIGAMLGINQRISNTGILGFRAGVKWINLNRDLTVGETTLEGGVDVITYSAELTYTQMLSRDTSMNVKAFADFGEAFTSLGGSFGVNHRF